MFYSRYRQDLAAARRRLRDCGSRSVETRLGPIECWIQGEGPPVLWVHGIVGGADQAPQSSQAYLGGEFRIIAVSRFGYLGSPLPRDPSPGAQADWYAALLDALQLRRAAVIGFSAGGPSSLQLALRHPDRCSALVLWSMAVPPYPVPPKWIRPLLAVGLRSDFALWCLMEYSPARLLGIMGVPRTVQAKLTPT
jgi:pimeloyl-ACP methyl ester carboxylesterase